MAEWQKLPFSVRFWQRIRDWAERNASEAWLNWWKHERRCMQCGTDMLRESLTRQRSLNIRDDGPIHEIGDCPRCHFPNRWFMGSMLPVGAPDFGSWQFLPATERDATVSGQGET